MAWLLVIIGGFFETLFAVFLKQSNGFTRPWPVVGFAISVAVSMGLLGLGLRDLPVGTAYAVWAGIGAVGTALVGMVFFDDAATFLRGLAVALIVGGIVMLNIAEGGSH